MDNACRMETCWGKMAYCRGKNGAYRRRKAESGHMVYFEKRRIYGDGITDAVRSACAAFIVQRLNCFSFGVIIQKTPVYRRAP